MKHRISRFRDLKRPDIPEKALPSLKARAAGRHAVGAAFSKLRATCTPAGG
jgi:fructose-bisphosphate aldolase class 1